MLLFVVDAAGSEGRAPVEDIATLRTEIKLYSDELSKRSWTIIANKTDLPEAEENIARLKERFKKIKVIPISANEGDGMDKLKSYLAEKIGNEMV